MTKRERVLAAISAGVVDRLPYSLWYHFHLTPPAGAEMTAAELGFYHRFDPDLLKVMHDVPYEMPADFPQVQTPADWRRLPVLSGVDGNFGAQLETVRGILAGRGDDGVVVDTVFNVFAIAQKVSGHRTLAHLAEDPESVHVGLQAIAASLCNYAKELIAAGADGIYLAVTGASADTMEAATYAANFAAYDQQVLEAAKDGRANVAHQHGVGIHPDIVLGMNGYQILSWSNQLAGNPGIREMRLRTTVCLMAGIDESTFGDASVDAVRQQAADAIAETNGCGFILAPGCAVPTPPESPAANLAAFREAVGA